MTTEGTAKTDTEVVSKEQYSKLEERARNFEAKLADYEKRFKGIDPEAYKAAKEENEILRRESVKADPKKLEEYETRLKTDFEKRYGDKFTELETTNKKLSEELKHERVIAKAMKEASGRFRPDANDFIRHLAQTNLDYVDGKIVVRGPDGKPTPSKTNPRNDMDLGEWLEGLADKYPSMAFPRGKGGAKEAGEKSSGTGSGSVDVERYLKMSNEERAALPIKVRQDLFKQAAEAAEKK